MNNGKYSKKIVNEICDAINDGLSNRDAMEIVGISEQTFYRWIREKPEFEKKLNQARIERKRELVKRIFKASSEQWQAAAWYLERVYNKEFAKREIQEHEGEINWSKLSEEQLDEIIKQTEKTRSKEGKD